MRRRLIRPVVPSAETRQANQNGICWNRSLAKLLVRYSTAHRRDCRCNAVAQRNAGKSVWSTTTLTGATASRHCKRLASNGELGLLRIVKIYRRHASNMPEAGLLQRFWRSVGLSIGGIKIFADGARPTHCPRLNRTKGRNGHRGIKVTDKEEM